MGGGGGGDPGAEARAQEADRQARIKAATETINAIFNNQVKQKKTVYRDGQGREIDQAEYQRQLSLPNRTGRNILERIVPPSMQEVEMWVPGDPANNRENLYKEQREAVFDLNSNEVERQAEEAARMNRFGLARTGLMGGSVDIDTNADLNRRTNEGLLRAGGIADASAAELKTQDERTRSNLISLAQSGIDTGSAATMALQGLGVNADQAASQRAGASIGGLFNDLSQAYLYNQAGKGRANASIQNPYAQPNYGVSNPRDSYAGN